MRAIEVMRLKRFPWDTLPDLVSHDLDLLAGGYLFPEGVYRFTMENAQALPQSQVLLEQDIPVTIFAFLYVQHPRVHDYGARPVFNHPEAPHAAWDWMPFTPYNDVGTGDWDVRVSTYIGEMPDPATWEDHGLDVFVRLESVRVLGLLARIGYYMLEEHPFSLAEAAMVNPTVARIPEIGDTWVQIAQDTLAK